MAIIIIIFVFACLLFWQVSIFISLWGGINYVGSGNDAIRLALKEVNLKSSQLFCELGSGFGNGLLIAANKFGAKAKGVEISPLYYLVSRLRTFRYKDIEIFFGDLRKINLSKADIVYCYLCPKLMQELQPKFDKELKKGSIVISKSFTLPDKKPFQIEIIRNAKVCFYKY